MEKQEDEEKTVVYSVNLLKSNYPTKRIFETDESYLGDDFNIYNNKIYFSTKEGNILEYSINEEKNDYLLDDNYKVVLGSTQIDKVNNFIYYIVEREGISEIYKMNLGTQEEDLVIKGFSVGYDLFLYNNKYLVCSLDNSYYLYNCENKNVWEICSNKANKNISGNVCFYNEQFVIFYDGKNVALKDFNGKFLNEKLYSVETEIDKSINNIHMVVQNKLQIEIEDSNEYFKTINIDLEKGIVEESNEIYLNVLNISK